MMKRGSHLLMKQRRWELVWFLLLYGFLIWLIGPGILLAFPLQRWASWQLWDAEERWDTLWYAMAVSLLCYLPLMLWHAQFVTIWQQIPWLGPATLASWRFRAFLGLFLSPFGPLVLERLLPRTNSGRTRIKRPEDRVAQFPAPAVQPDAFPRESEKRRMPTAKRPRFLPPLHRPGGNVVVERSPRSQREVLLQEQQRQQTQQTSRVALEPMPPPAPQRINWDEGEGTYREH